MEPAQKITEAPVEAIEIVLNNVIESMIKALQSYEAGQFSNFIKNLFQLREEASKISPEIMHLDFVDFMMDENMWSWVMDCLDANSDPTPYDLKAAEFAAIDLKDIIQNNKIIK